MKIRILFVDDDQNILDGFKRSLRPMRGQWDVSTVGSGDEALKTLALKSIDILVADMRMPGMDGVELLGKVKYLYPHIVRIILSGHSDQEMILKSVPLAHQYLSKPCETESLKETINNAYELHSLLKEDVLKDLVSQLSTIPSIPTLYNSLIVELQSPEASIKRIGDIISKDAGMTAKILQLVNSAFFGLKRSVHSTEEAVHLLGLDIVKTLVLSIEIFSKFNQSDIKSQDFSIDRLMNHSLICANYARLIAREEKADKTFQNDAFTAGVLHDVGVLLLVANLPQEYNRVTALAAKNNLLPYEAEQLIFGTGHAEVGAYLLGLWGLPDRIMDAVAFHHRPQGSASKTFVPLTAVHAADIFDHNKHDDINGAAYALDMAYLENLRMSLNAPLWTKLCADHY